MKRIQFTCILIAAILLVCATATAQTAPTVTFPTFK